MIPRTTVSILSWNCLEGLKLSVDRLRRDKENDEPFEITVVDQSSTDGTQEWLKDQADVTGIVISPGSGVSEGKNTQAKMCRTELCMLLDVDMIPLRHSVLGLTRWLDNHPGYVGVGLEHRSATLLAYQDFNDELRADEANASIMNSSYPNSMRHYSLWKTKYLLEFPAPEFPPFSGPGWGADDTVVGIALINSGAKLGVLDQPYLHAHHFGNSVQNLGYDEYHRSAVARNVCCYAVLGQMGEKLAHVLREQKLGPFNLNVGVTGGDEELRSFLLTALRETLPYVRVLFDVLEKADVELLLPPELPAHRSENMVIVGCKAVYLRSLLTRDLRTYRNVVVFPFDVEEYEKIEVFIEHVPCARLNPKVAGVVPAVGHPCLALSLHKHGELNAREPLYSAMLREPTEITALTTEKLGLTHDARSASCYLELRRAARLKSEHWIKSLANFALQKSKKSYQ